MNKVNNKSELCCNICNKIYASKSSLCNHNKKFHKINVINGNPIITPNNLNDNLIITPKKKYKCIYCNFEFSHFQNRWRHEQKCKNKENKIDEINELKQTINELKNQVALILKEKGKIHHKTLQKINNQLNVNNINNGSIVNNTYVKFGELEYEKILNNNQIKYILNKQYKCLEESIKQIHFNEDIPEYNNVFITNMKDVNNKRKFIIFSINDEL